MKAWNKVRYLFRPTTRPGWCGCWGKAMKDVTIWSCIYDDAILTWCSSLTSSKRVTALMRDCSGFAVDSLTVGLT